MDCSCCCCYCFLLNQTWIKFQRSFRFDNFMLFIFCLSFTLYIEQLSWFCRKKTVSWKASNVNSSQKFKQSNLFSLSHCAKISTGTVMHKCKNTIDLCKIKNTFLYSIRVDFLFVLDLSRSSRWFIACVKSQTVMPHYS